MSPFLTPFPKSSPHGLAILHLSRHLQIPVQLKETNQDVSTTKPTAPSTNGVARETVINTRFGSYPHDTLTYLPWGSQVLASKVDTGSWGRQPSRKKRKREESQKHDSIATEPDKNSIGLMSTREEGGHPLKPPTTADSGFAHLVPPTPEVWTRALRHRTQVVYTPDYSYILQRLRVRPGTCIIEAGAGSGSFTHAAARAVFNGYPPASDQQGTADGAVEEVENAVGQKTELARPKKRNRYGKVYSFEFHEPRFRLLDREIKDHDLQDIVQLTNRDVYEEGFCLYDSYIEGAPRADAIFLDLPAPWLALKHLTREGSTKQAKNNNLPGNKPQSDPSKNASLPENSKHFYSPLNPLTTTRICTFSPCIEQAQRTITTMRSLGWIEIEMVEIMQKRLEVRRERVGLHEEGLRGVNPSPASVGEAIGRLKEIESRQKAPRDLQVASLAEESQAPGNEAIEGEEKMGDQEKLGSLGTMTKAERLQRIREEEGKRKLYKEGRLVHRTEPDLKTHTSYLVFAVLPRQWTAEDEARCRRKWPLDDA